ncbi:MAG: CDP-alcohol phosphatidyltransferase family protein [Bdellovibrio sp.]|nr:CDP-alcohol phosphatidyltransferase family protein [Bdellovibrio sp.]
MDVQNKDLSSRRVLKSRDSNWARTTAKALASSNISPNQISVLSVFFAMMATAFFYAAYLNSNRLMLILAIVVIQLRLICNLMDGLVAIEFNKKSKTGDLYNEIPDRLADTAIIMGAGLYVQQLPYGMDIAWACVALAILTAYIRTLGASLGKGHKFLGPMAKQHRMALLTVAIVVEAVLHINAIYYSLWIMLVGLVLTNIRRTIGIAKALEETP